MRFIGVDLHKAYAYVVELSADLQKKHYRLCLTSEALSSFLETLDKECQVVLEASTTSFRFAELVAPWVGRVVVSDPAQTRGAVSQPALNDHKSAEALARLLHANFVREVWVPPASVRALRSQVALYRRLGRTRTRACNMLKSLFQQEILPVVKVRKPGPRSHSWMAEQFREQPQLRLYLCCLLRIINLMNSELAELEYALGGWCKQSSDAQLLLTVPGMGAILAVTLLAQIGDIRRFPTASQLCSYAGLVPKVYESGKTRHYGHISRSGGSNMRWALNVAVWSGSGRVKTIDEFRRRLVTTRPKMVANTAAARKLLTIIWSMLTHRRRYQDEDTDLSVRKWMSLGAWPEPSPQALEVPKIKDRRPSVRVRRVRTGE
ncbi:MAG: IS110 family transposase [Candidatus Eremiobacteraeota bacterium]|nr:IS110 family transposase [Candidatus Eremiobacteraeota bacterium]